MSVQVEGRLTFGGLIEGQLPPEPGMPERLRGWVTEAGAAGLDLELDLEGGRFGLLATTESTPAARFGPKPAERVKELLGRLAALFPEPRAAGLFSTLRSVEIAPGHEIQTVYLFGPDGSVEAPERAVAADTAPPPRPESRREILRAAGVSVVVLAALIGVTSLFVDWGGLLSSLWSRVAPLDVNAIEVEAGAFTPYFTVEKGKAGSSGTTLRLTLRREPAFPTSETQLRAAYAALHGGPPERLVLDAIARGYVRVEVFDAEGGFRGHTELRVAGLADHETVVVDLPLSRDPRPARIVLRY